MTDFEFERIKQQGLNLGLFIFKAIKEHKKVGVFGKLDEDDSTVRWVKSMFHGREISGAEFEAVWDSHNVDTSNYDMAVLINFKFNQRLNEIKFRKTTSYTVGLNGFIPVIQIDYCLIGDKFVSERDCNYITDGISDVRVRKQGYVPQSKNW